MNGDGNGTRPLAGLVALVLAAGVAVALAAGLIILSLGPKPVDSELEAVFTTLAGAAVGAVGTYIGTTVRGSTPAPPEPEPDGEPEADAEDEPGPGSDPEVSTHDEPGA